MVTIPVNITGGTFKHKSLPLSAQKTTNFWPQKQEGRGALSSYVLDSYPGKKLFGTVEGIRNRGIFEHRGVLYKVTDETLYTVASDGTHSVIGEILGSDKCIFAGINDDVVITTEGVVYEWNGSTEGTRLYTGEPDIVISSNFDVQTSNTVVISSKGILYSVSSAICDTGTAATFPSSKWGIFIVSSNTSGDLVATWDTNSSSGYDNEAAAIVALPTTPTGDALLGYVTVQADLSNTFLVGTDALEGGTGGDPANATNYYNADNSFITVNNANLETPNSCAHINNQMLYDGDGDRWVPSDVGDATSIDALNYARAESNADDLLRVYTFNQSVYLMGTKSIEVWWNSGVGKPPFDRIEGAISQVGLGALHSVANSRNVIYFVGSDNQVYAISGSQTVPVFTGALAREIENFSTISDAEGICYNFEGQWFYEVSFPSADRTFCYPEGGEVFELSSGNENGRNITSGYAFAFRKHLVGDVNNGNIYELDKDTYTDNGEPIIRTRDTAPIHGGLVKSPGKRIEMSRFELILETGVGLLSGQGKDPKIMLSFSDDGGKTFSTEMWGNIGKLGEFQYKVEWFALGSFYERILRVRISDPVYCCIYSAAIDIEVGI